MDRERYGWIAGRVLLSAIFIVSALGKLADVAGTTAYMAKAGIPLAGVFLALAIAVELGGGVAVATGWAGRLGALALVVYLVPVTIVFHGFWAAAGPERQMQTVNFLKNVAIMGGLLLVAYAPEPEP